MASAYPRSSGSSAHVFAAFAITTYLFILAAAESESREGGSAQSALAASYSRSQNSYAWLENEKDDSPEVQRLRSKIQLLAESVDSFAAGHHKQLPKGAGNSQGGLVDAGADAMQLPDPNAFQGGVSDWIRQVVLPNLRKTTEAMQAEVDKAEKTVKECSGTMFTAEKQVEHAEKILQGDEGEKFKCLHEEHKAAKDQKNACDDFENLAKFLVENAPPLLTNRSSVEVGEHIREHNIFADKYQAEIRDKKDLCNAAKDKLAKAHEECEADEETIEAFYCHMKAGRDAACAEYGQCYNETILEFEKVAAKIKVLDGHVVEHFKNVACFSSGVGAEREQQDCDQVLVDKSEEQLEVEYPATPMREECVHIMHTGREYANITCNGDQPVKKEPAPEPVPESAVNVPESAVNKSSGGNGPTAPTPAAANTVPAPVSANSSLVAESEHSRS